MEWFNCNFTSCWVRDEYDNWMEESDLSQNSQMQIISYFPANFLMELKNVLNDRELIDCSESLLESEEALEDIGSFDNHNSQ